MHDSKETRRTDDRKYTGRNVEEAGPSRRKDDVVRYREQALRDHEANLHGRMNELKVALKEKRDIAKHLKSEIQRIKERYVTCTQDIHILDALLTEAESNYLAYRRQFELN